MQQLQCFATWQVKFTVGENVFLLCLKHSAEEISFKDISPMFFWCAACFRWELLCFWEGSWEWSRDCLCSVSSLNRAGVIPALPWTKCLKPAHPLSRACTGGWRRFWAAVRDWKKLVNHKEKFFLIKVIERVEILCCNEISRVGCPHWWVCATFKMKPWWWYLPFLEFGRMLLSGVVMNNK